MINNTIKNYNDMLYDSGPVKFSEFISDKYNILHNKLYLNAVDKLVNYLINIAKNNNEKKLIFNYTTKEEFYENTKIIEIKNTEYWKPSLVLIINLQNKYKRAKYDLTNFWNQSLNKPLKNVKDIKLTESPVLDGKVKYINYVDGYVDMESKMQDIEFNLDFDYLDENTEIDDDYLLNNTFTNKYNAIK